MFEIENMFEIERNVKMPGKGAGEFISVMQKMEAGDSFVVNDREITPRVRSNIYAAARVARIVIKQKTIYGGLRIWKVSDE